MVTPAPSDSTDIVPVTELQRPSRKQAWVSAYR